jgi:hypothetical protein
MSNDKSTLTRLLDAVLDGTWNRFTGATEWLKDVVDTQPWTHVLLGIALWFVIVWLKDHSILFHFAWIPWIWYWLVIVGAPFRIGHRY